MRAKTDSALLLVALPEEEYYLYNLLAALKREPLRQVMGVAVDLGTCGVLAFFQGIADLLAPKINDPQTGYLFFHGLAGREPIHMAEVHRANDKCLGIFYEDKDGGRWSMEHCIEIVLSQREGVVDVQFGDAFPGGMVSLKHFTWRWHNGMLQQNQIDAKGRR